MKNKFLILFLAIALGISFQSCRKGPGPGGKASVTGKVYEKKYNSTFTVLISEYYVGDYDVYLVYGDDATYSDKTSTHHDGTYEFNYLLPGDYTLYVYSKDKTGNSPSGEIVVEQTITISDKKETIILGDFIVEDN